MRLIMCYPHDVHLPLLGEGEGDNEKKVFDCLKEKSLIRSQWFYSRFPVNLQRAVMFTNSENSYTSSPNPYPKSVNLSPWTAWEFWKSQYAPETRQEIHQAEQMERGAEEWNEGHWDLQLAEVWEDLRGGQCFSQGGQIGRRRCGVSYIPLGGLRVWRPEKIPRPAVL